VADITYYYDIACGMLVASYSAPTNTGKGDCYGPPGGIAPACLNPSLAPLCAADGAIIDRGFSDGSTSD
jgi:hypothetical protein